MPDLRDPRLSMDVAGLAGGGLLAMWTAFNLLFSPTPVTGKTAAQAAVLTLCSLGSGWIGAHYVGGALVDMFNISTSSLRDLIGLAVGVGFWKAVPGLVDLSARYNVGSVARLLPGGKPKDSAQ